MTAVQEAVAIMDAFILAITDADNSNFSVYSDSLPPLTVYDNGTKFFAWDVENSRFFVDKNYVMSIPYDFRKTPEILDMVTKVCQCTHDTCLESMAYSWNQTMGA